MAAISELRRLLLPIAAIMAVVVASNILVQYPVTAFGLQDYLTWGAFSYPVAFLVSDLTNRRFGAAAARQVVLVAFPVAVLLSALVSTPRIAVASGTAFLVGQLLDISVFDRLRRLAWWRAPLVSSLFGSALDTALFFSLAFAGAITELATYGFGTAAVTVPVWIGWAVFDFVVKVLSALLMLVPYGALLSTIRPLGAPAR